jgi:hypothetical protein
VWRFWAIWGACGNSLYSPPTPPIFVVDPNLGLTLFRNAAIVSVVEIGIDPYHSDQSMECGLFEFPRFAQSEEIGVPQRKRRAD